MKVRSTSRVHAEDPENHRVHSPKLLISKDYIYFLEIMEDSAERQMSSSIAWFRDWTTNERKSFGQVIIETEKNQGNLSY